MTRPEKEWRQLRLQEAATDDPLVRAEKARDNEERNIAGWKAQAARMQAAGREPPTGLWSAIQESEQAVERLTGEILALERAAHDERQRVARRRNADQARRVGQALPDNEEDR
jgi:hypothetical protein